MTELFNLMNRNCDKIIPAKILMRCIELQTEEVNETLKARFLVMVYREFRKTREQTKYKEQKKMAD